MWFTNSRLLTESAMESVVRLTSNLLNRSPLVAAKPRYKREGWGRNMPCMICRKSNAFIAVLKSHNGGWSHGGDPGSFLISAHLANKVGVKVGCRVKLSPIQHQRGVGGGFFQSYSIIQQALLKKHTGRPSM